MLGDFEARQRAIDPTESFIVQAPAGSGKTGLITQRYLALLATVEQPEEILAITFTRKAANEMRERIIEALNSATMPEPEEEHERNIWRLAKAALRKDAELSWSIIENPARLRIQTIDSLSASIVKQMPLVARFGAQPGIEEYAEPIYQKAAEQFIQAVVIERQFSDDEGKQGKQNVSELESAVLTLLAALNNNVPKLAELFTVLLARRDQWVRHFISGDRIQRDALESALNSYLTSKLEELLSFSPASIAPDLFLLVANLIENQDCLNQPLPDSHSLFVLQQFSHWPNTVDESLPFWQALADWLLTGSGALRKAPRQTEGFVPGAKHKKVNAEQKELRKRVFDALESYPKFIELLAEVKQLPNPSYSEWQWQFIEALMQCLHLLLAYLKLEFQAQSKVDFIELSMSAMYALNDESGVTDVGLKLDYQISHILVDEFQDTSHGQFELLKQLTMGWEPDDGRTLFLVGDPMQSIYRFREADVGLFLSCRHEGLGDIPLTPLSLTTNFRSTAGVVNWVNQAFAKIFPAKENAALGAVALSVAEAKSDDEQPAVEFIHQFTGEQDSFQALKATSLIQTIKQQSPNESVAVLVRSKNHASEIIELLQQANIQVEAVEMESLSQRTLIKILVNLTRWLINSSDDLALAAILRSQLVGCSVKTLTYLFNAKISATLLLKWWHALYSNKTSELNVSLSESLFEGLDNQPASETVPDDVLQLVTETFSCLERDQQVRVISFYARIQPVLKDIGRLPVTEVVRAAWVRLGGLQAYPAERDRRDINQYFQALNQKLATSEIVEVSQLERLVDRLFSATDTCSDGFKVTVMTIHKSKGLEFDHVIMPHLEKRSAQDGTQLMLWQELPQQSADNFLVAPVKANLPEDDRLYLMLDAINKQKQLYENGRLLYVGATRAKKRLYLLAESAISESNDERTVRKPNPNSLLAQLWPVIDSKVNQQLSQVNFCSDNSVVNMAERRTWSRVKQDAVFVYPRARAQIESRLKTLSNDEAAQDYQWSSDNAAIVGNLVHSMLEKIANQGFELWSIERLQQQKSFFRSYFIRQHVALQNLDECVDKTLRALMNTIDDPDGRWLLSDHIEAKTELPLSTRFHEQFRSYVIDRTFVDNGIRWIIDYKSSELVGASSAKELTKFYQAELDKYRPQLKQYAYLMQQLDSRPVRCALYLPMHQKLIEYQDLN